MKYSKGYKAFMDKYPEVGKHVETLFMENRSIGRHAGGVIIAPPEELASTMPIIGVRGDLQTPWTEGMNFRNLTYQRHGLQERLTDQFPAQVISEILT